MINLVGYKILMTYDYMSYFYMPWIEVCLYSPKGLIKLSDGFYMLKHRK